MKVVITEAAWDDLFHIGRYISEDNPRRAVTFLAELEERCLKLGSMPRAFPLIPRYEDRGVRRRPYGNYLIFYRIGAEQVEILHVLNAAQDVEALLFPDGP